MRKVLFTTILVFLALSSVWGKTYDERVKYKKGVYDNILSFIKEHPNSPDLPTLYFQLAKLSLEIDVEDPALIARNFKSALDTNLAPEQREEALYWYGINNENAVTERLNEERTQYLAGSNNYDYPDRIRYSEANYQETIKSYNEVLQNTKSQFYSDILYKSGLLYFNIMMDARGKKDYSKAQSFFDRMAKLDGDRLQYIGVYHRGITKFASGQYDEAIEDFAAVLRYVEKNPSVDNSPWFQIDGVQRLAKCLDDYDENTEQASVAAQKARQSFIGLVGEEHGKEIINLVINQKKKLRAYMQAVDFYNAYIDLYPLSVNCPAYVDSIYQTLRSSRDQIVARQLDPEKLLFEQHERLVNTYNASSPWFQANKGKDIKAQMAIILDAFDDVEREYYIQGTKDASDANYNRYLQITTMYLEFLKAYGGETVDKETEMRGRICDLSLIRAEKSGAAGDLLLAIKHIDDFNNARPTNPKFEYYEEKRFLSLSVLYSNMNKMAVDSTYTDSKSGMSLTLAQLNEMYVQGSLRYEKVLANRPESAEKSKKLTELLLERCRIYYNRGDYENALSSSDKLLTYNLDRATKKETYQRMAEIVYNQKQYDKSVEYYTEAIKYTDAKADVDAYRNNIRVAKENKAGNLGTGGNHELAAQVYLNLAAENATSNQEFSKAYKAKAIEEYRNAGKYEDAIMLLREIGNAAKTEQECLSSYNEAWDLAAEHKDWDMAVDLRNQFIAKYPNSHNSYQVQMQIVGYYLNEQYNDKAKGADMLMEMYTNNKKWNLGDENPADALFLPAIAIWKSLNNQDKKFELYWRFQQEYPKRPEAKDFLMEMAAYYQNNNDDENLNKVAKRLLQIDPNSKIYEDLAKMKLADQLEDAQKVFLAGLDNGDKTAAELDKKRVEFDALVKKYEAEGLKNLPVQGGYTAFKDYRTYFDLENSFKNEISLAYKNFLSIKAEDMVVIRPVSNWQRNMWGGDARLPKVADKADATAERLSRNTLANEDYEGKTAFGRPLLDVLPMERRTHIVFLCGDIYRHANEVVNTQFQRFVTTTNDMKMLKSQAPEQYAAVVQQMRENFIDPQLIERCNFSAEGYYQQLMEAYLDSESDNGYIDTWLLKASDRLVELGKRPAGKTQGFFTDESWQVGSRANSSSWDDARVSGREISLFANAKALEVNSGANSFRKQFTVNNPVKKIAVTYVASAGANVYINGQAQGTGKKLDAQVYIDGQAYDQYQLMYEQPIPAGQVEVVVDGVPANLGKFAATIKVSGDVAEIVAPQENGEDMNNMDVPQDEPLNVPEQGTGEGDNSGTDDQTTQGEGE